MHKRALKEDRRWRLSGLVVLREGVGSHGFWDGLGRILLLNLAIVSCVSVVFTVINHVVFWFILATIPFALLLGIVLHFMHLLADRLWAKTVKSSGYLQTAFLFFFLYLPAYVLLFYLFLAYPLGLTLSKYISPELAVDYRRWILDVAAFSALGAWGRIVFRKS